MLAGERRLIQIPFDGYIISNKPGLRGVGVPLRVIRLTAILACTRTLGAYACAARKRAAARVRGDRRDIVAVSFSWEIKRRRRGTSVVISLFARRAAGRGIRGARGGWPPGLYSSASSTPGCSDSRREAGSRKYERGRVPVCTYTPCNSCGVAFQRPFREAEGWDYGAGDCGTWDDRGKLVKTRGALP